MSEKESVRERYIYRERGGERKRDWMSEKREWLNDITEMKWIKIGQL